MPEQKPEWRGGGSVPPSVRGGSGQGVPRAGAARLGRRTTLAVACVLTMLGGPATMAAAYAAPTAPVAAPAAPSAPAALRGGPTPQPSPGVPPRPDGQDRPGAPGADAGQAPGGPGGDSDAGVGAARDDSGAPSGGAGDDHWSGAVPGEGTAEETGGDAATEGPQGGPSADLPPVDGESTLEEIRKRIKALHDRAGSATDAYNAAEEKAKKQREKIEGLERRVASTEERLAELRQRAGAVARAQYRNGGLSSAARLMLSDDPEEFLRDADLARKGLQAADALVSSLAATTERLERYTEDARERYAELEQNRRNTAAARKRVEKQLEKAEALESRLAAEQRERLRELERQAAYARQLRWLRSGILAQIGTEASDQGRKALAYATAQLGKDYEWGAEGPATYDCSGLTMRAWEAAGVTIPRTSQQQWGQLPRVDVADMRPGDLIVYKSDASHVGMYMGDGVMIHAPRTGRQITVEGAGSYQILGVVRPDK